MHIQLNPLDIVNIEYGGNIILKSVRHHDYFITQGNCVGYTFRL